ncbi:MAG: hypothetical protein ABI834_03180 [Ginsengibacter sp.]
MVILQIEHPVPDFDAWKKIFDSDPGYRKEGKVRGYKILRPVDNLNYAIIHLEFDNANDAISFQQVLKKLWANVDGKLINGPQSKILEIVESKEII